jgi:DNA-binding NarL/FixJ family response regulator
MVDPRLRPSEWRVLARLAQGESNAAIGMALGLARTTVGQHLSSIYRELGLRGQRDKRCQAARWYREHAEEDPEQA